MKIKTLLVDDDFKACQNLRLLIEDNCPNLVYCDEAHSLDEAAKKVLELRPDLIFLDIMLGDDLGFDLFSLVDLTSCKVIVVSAFEDFALRAFRFSAIDYLLKPIDIIRLMQAVEKVENEFAKSTNSNRLNDLLKIVNRDTSSAISPSVVPIPTVFGSVFLNYINIVRCEAERNYTRIYSSEDKPILSSKTLSEIEQLLPDSIFIRIHHSHVINLNMMREYHKGKQSYVVLNDDSSIPISQNKKSTFLKRIKHSS